MTARTMGSRVTQEMLRRALEGRRVNIVNPLVALTLLICLLASLAILVVLLWDVVAKSMPVWQERGWSVITNDLSPRPAETGMIQGIFGSVMLTVIVVVLSFPLGVAAAIYLEEYARDTRITRLLVANIRNLAGVPSIVYGLLGLSVFVKLILEGVLGQISGRTLIAGGLTLSMLVLSIMVITTQEALRAVPLAIREASFGVGATPWQTIRHHVLPVASPAIFTGSVLTLARAFGESAPLLLAGAVLSTFFAAPEGTPITDLVLGEKYTALPIIIYNWSRQPQQEYIALTAAAIVALLVILLVVNTGTILARDALERRNRM
ncbi:MAG: phosphate ABC transporter permease PstA [bacterium]|nr:phosphate ABC transporter permease PstA [bacterium]